MILWQVSWEYADGSDGRTFNDQQWADNADDLTHGGRIKVLSAEPLSDKIVENVRKKLRDRSAAGIKKYGTPLTRTDLTELQWLIHAQEEALDLANYLEVLIQRNMNEQMELIKKRADEIEALGAHEDVVKYARSAKPQ